jgi:hypothetical protein
LFTYFAALLTSLNVPCHTYSCLFVLHYDNLFINLLPSIEIKMFLIHVVAYVSRSHSHTVFTYFITSISNGNVSYGAIHFKYTEVNFDNLFIKFSRFCMVQMLSAACTPSCLYSSTLWHFLQQNHISFARVDIHCLDTNLAVDIAAPMKLAVTSFSNCCLLRVITSTATHQVTAVHPLWCPVTQSTLSACQHTVQSSMKVETLHFVLQKVHTDFVKFVQQSVHQWMQQVWLQA